MTSQLTKEDSDHDFSEAVKRELVRARTKFPSCALSTIALMEEVGELAQALLKWRAGKGQWHQVESEAVQVAALAQRIAVEGDESVVRANYSEPGK